MKEMKISFPGGKKVNSYYKGFTVETDQRIKAGGAESAPEPYDLFLASLGTCAGIYVVYFCEERSIDISGLEMTVSFEKNKKTHLVERVRIHMNLPPGFPKKYKTAVVRTAGLCTVKRSLANPPQFEIVADIQGK